MFTYQLNKLLPNKYAMLLRLLLLQNYITQFNFSSHRKSCKQNLFYTQDILLKLKFCGWVYGTVGNNNSSSFARCHFNRELPVSICQVLALTNLIFRKDS